MFDIDDIAARNAGRENVDGNKYASQVRFNRRSGETKKIVMVRYSRRLSVSRMASVDWSEPMTASRILKKCLHGVVYFVSGMFVSAMVHVAIAEYPAPQPMLRLNHVAVNVVDLAAALQYYRDKFGFRAVARLTGADQKPMAAYLQVSRDTFIELWQANAQRPPGLDHFGLEAADIKAASDTLRKHAVTVSETVGPMSFTGGFIANITDGPIGRIELTAQPAGGKLRQAAEDWR